MDIASKALLRTFVGLIAAFIIYRIARPAAARSDPVATGRSFFAWTAAICSLTYFGKWVFVPTADNLAIWIISVVIIGGVAFLLGLAWGAFKKRKRADAKIQAIVSKTVHHVAVNAEARKILEIRLSKGEITISEFKELVSALAEPLPPARKAKAALADNGELEKEQRAHSGRKAYLAELKEEFGFLVKCRIPDSEILSDKFNGDRQSLPSPKRLSDVSDATGMLEFKLIDAVKAGLISGVREASDEWWISKKHA